MKFHQVSRELENTKHPQQAQHPHIDQRQRCFEQPFIDLARAVYRTNDRRAALKREINERYGSTLIEQKSYSLY